MSESRRSRTAWPSMTSDRRAPNRPRRLALTILYVAVVINMLLSALIFSYVLVLKHARDTEQARLERLVELNNCSLTDQLPAGPPLDRLRALYHCGPGLPVSPTIRP